MTRIVLLAGPSGSGKSLLAGHCGALVFRLDDFYFDADRPGLPRTPFGVIDWDDPATWDAEGAASALAELVASGTVEVPVYDIALSRRTGTHGLNLAGHPLVIAEGIFAVELLAVARAHALAVEPLYLDRPRTLVALLRLRRDLRQHRKPPLVLLKRGLALWRDQPALRGRAVAAGFRPVSMQRALALVASTVGAVAASG